ncbi:hypothetical protein D3C77_588320 [compost metagenome]
MFPLFRCAQCVYGGDTSQDLRGHPLVTRHPETGKKVLFINPAYTTGIQGLRTE